MIASAATSIILSGISCSAIWRSIRSAATSTQAIWRLIGSVQSYFEANMSLMLQEVREQLFAKDRPVFTKVRDDMPARYGLGASVSNSIIADGCVVDGTVETVCFSGA